MRICIDLDGVICELKRADEEYAEVKPKPGAPAKIRRLRESGHYIIIYTARRMRTFGGSVGKIIAAEGYSTIDWLKRHEVPFDELHFGKPWADIYIDDNAFRFESWDAIDSDGRNLQAIALAPMPPEG